MIEEIVSIITTEQAWHYHIVPKQKTIDQISFYADIEFEHKMLNNEIEFILGCTVSFDYIPSLDFNQLLARYYPPKKNTFHATNFFEDLQDIDKLIFEALDRGASDIHIEPLEAYARIRMRIDGSMLESYRINKEKYPALINQIKIKSNLDISEKRLPQDGRLIFKNNGSPFDLRISVIPSIYGEKIVMRLLTRQAELLALSKIGLSSVQLNQFYKALDKLQGLVLISGPTGSGKTTTLYSVLNYLNKPIKNILTIEDPIEFTIEGITQVALRDNIGLSFAKAMRSFLRQDPDIIMVGEIRDEETAEMAIRASLTGHLVLSTIHTNSALGILPRLVDMGVPKFLLAQTLHLAVAQRLIKKLCVNCKVLMTTKNDRIINEFFSSGELTSCFEPVGCQICNYTGFFGRIAIFEVINLDENMINSFFAINSEEMWQTKHGHYQRIQDQAKALFVNGITSYSEIAPYLN